MGLILDTRTPPVRQGGGEGVGLQGGGWVGLEGRVRGPRGGDGLGSMVAVVGEMGLRSCAWGSSLLSMGAFSPLARGTF